ncbi:hypothetical protein C8R43DRAFT_1122219 [Mycena crocata]|nr:hypothetical protein C8R43DRAFT_1122219 [Mycena crocata]
MAREQQGSEQKLREENSEDEVIFSDDEEVVAASYAGTQEAEDDGWLPAATGGATGPWMSGLADEVRYHNRAPTASGAGAAGLWMNGLADEIQYHTRAPTRPVTPEAPSVPAQSSVTSTPTATNPAPVVTVRAPAPATGLANAGPIAAAPSNKHTLASQNEAVFLCATGKAAPTPKKSKAGMAPANVAPAASEEAMAAAAILVSAEASEAAERAADRAAARAGEREAERAAEKRTRGRPKGSGKKTGEDEHAPAAAAPAPVTAPLLRAPLVTGLKTNSVAGLRQEMKDERAGYQKLLQNLTGRVEDTEASAKATQLQMKTILRTLKRMEERMTEIRDETEQAIAERYSTGSESESDIQTATRSRGNKGKASPGPGSAAKRVHMLEDEVQIVEQPPVSTKRRDRSPAAAGPAKRQRMENQGTMEGTPLPQGIPLEQRFLKLLLRGTQATTCPTSNKATISTVVGEGPRGVPVVKAVIEDGEVVNAVHVGDEEVTTAVEEIVDVEETVGEDGTEDEEGTVEIIVAGMEIDKGKYRAADVDLHQLPPPFEPADSADIEVGPISWLPHPKETAFAFIGHMNLDGFGPVPAPYLVSDPDDNGFAILSFGPGNYRTAYENAVAFAEAWNGWIRCERGSQYQYTSANM